MTQIEKTVDAVIQFTPESIDRAQVNKRTRVKDPNGSGLVIDITERGDKTFRVRRKVKGRVIFVTLGKFTADNAVAREQAHLGDRQEFFSVKQARERARLIFAQMKDGQSAAEVNRRLRGEPTLESLFETYWKEHLLVHTKRHEDQRAIFYRHVKPLMKKRFSEITRSDIKRLQETIATKREAHPRQEESDSDLGRKRPGPARTKPRPEPRQNGGTYAANRTIQLIRAVINHGLKEDIIQGQNPAAQIKLFKETARGRVLMPDEYLRLMEALETEPSQDLKDIVLMLLGTAMRKANVLAMKFSDINMDLGIWKVSGQETKNGQTHVLRFDADGMEIIRRRRDEVTGDYVFPGSGRTGHVTEIRKSFNSLLERARIKGFVIHDLRRTMGSWIIDSGGTDSMVQGVLSHKDPKTARRAYIHTRLDAETEARQKALQKLIDESKKIALLTPRASREKVGGGASEKKDQAVSDRR